jgi:hypothetical protein
LKKSDKIKLAESCYKQIKELGLEVTIQDNWLHFATPKKMPAELIMDITHCSEYLVKLFQEAQ